MLNNVICCVFGIVWSVMREHLVGSSITGCMAEKTKKGSESEVCHLIHQQMTLITSRCQNTFIYFPAKIFLAGWLYFLPLVEERDRENTGNSSAWLRP